MRRFLIIALLLAPAGAAAQQPAQPSAAEQALGEKLLREIQEGLRMQADLIETKRKLADAEKKLKDLEKPAEPSK